MSKGNGLSMEETCVICESEKKSGIHLYTVFVCEECERLLIQTDADDPLYKEYIVKLKKMLAPGILN